jgi:hypothetical protein
MLNKEKIIQSLSLKFYGAKGWMRSNSCECPDCSHSDKFGILFVKDSGLVKCQRCNYSTSLYNYLKRIDRKDLISFKKEYNLLGKLPELIKKKEIEVVDSLPNKRPPFGFKRIYYDDYLDSRGFEPYQYNQYNVGTSTESRLKNYIVSLIKQEGNVVGWIARSKHSKEWHEANLKAFKAKEEDLKLRYINSIKTNFDRILLGVDELTEDVHTVYLVEGWMDKVNVDNKLKLYFNKEVKCCATFGNKVTHAQQELLKKFNIKVIVVMFDFGTIKQSKDSSMELGDYFEVKIAEFKDKNIDAGDASAKYLLEIISNSKDFSYFYKYRINEFTLTSKKKLR